MADENNEEQGFEDAFAEFSGREKVEGEVLPDGNKPADEAPADPFAWAPEEKRAELAELATKAKERDDYFHRHQSDSGRIGAFQRKLNEVDGERQRLAQELETVRKGSGGDTPTKSEVSAALADPEKWEKFKEDFPEVAEGMEAIVGPLQKQIKSLESKVGGFEQDVTPLRNMAVKNQEEQEIAALAAKHPDFDKKVASPEFAEWYNKQHPTVQGLYGSPMAADAAYLLDLYDQSRGATPSAADALRDKRRTNLAEGAYVKGRNAAVTTAVPDDFEGAFEHFAAKKDRQRK